MDPDTLRSYVDGYDDRRAALLATRREVAATARSSTTALATICRRYGARSVRLFGSLVTGHLGPEPDIDLAVEGVPRERFLDLYAEVLRAAPVPVDLVDLDTAAASLRTRIEHEGKDL